MYNICNQYFSMLREIDLRVTVRYKRLRLYKMRLLKYYVESKTQLETWK